MMAAHARTHTYISHYHITIAITIRITNMKLNHGHTTSVPPIRRTRRLKERVDSIPVRDIRTAMSMSLARTNVKNDDFAKFARLDNADETCATTGTAGEDGVDGCTTQCRQRSHFWGRMPDEGACYVLCSVAVHPCARFVPWNRKLLYESVCEYDTACCRRRGVYEEREIDHFTVVHICIVLLVDTA